MFVYDYTCSWFNAYVCPSCLLFIHFPLTDDTVYVENADRRREYIQNGSGKIFVGSFNNISVFDWEYDQVIL